VGHTAHTRRAGQLLTENPATPTLVNVQQQPDEGPVHHRQTQGADMYTKPIIITVEKIEAKAVRRGSHHYETRN
jgi:hypothetical protein